MAWFSLSQQDVEKKNAVNQPGANTRTPPLICKHHLCHMQKLCLCWWWRGVGWKL